MAAWSLHLGACGVEAPTSDGPTVSLAGCGATQCEIALSHAVTISDSARAGMLPPRFLYLEQDGLGRLIAAAATLDHVVIFDSTGAFLASIGGRGDAPGEFWRIAQPLVGPGDTIFVHDYRQGRLTVLSPRLELVRVATNVLYPPDLVLIDGTFVVGRQIPTASRIGYPIHVMTPDGEISRSFGTDVPEYRPDLRWYTNRIVGPGSGGTIWAAPIGRYVLERWDPATGERLARVDVSSTWFVGAPGPHEDPFQPPDPIIEAVMEDHRGLVWVLLRDAAADWQPPHPSDVNWEQPVTPESYDAAHDWVLEVVDPETAAVIASRRFESAPWLNPRSMLLATLRPYWVDPDPEAHVTFDVWQLDLVPKEEHR